MNEYGGKLKQGNLPAYNTHVLTGKEKGRYFFISLLSLFLLGFLFYKNFFLCGVIMLLSFPGRKYYESYLAEKDQALLTAQFRDLLYSLSSSVTAGRQLPEAVVEAEVQLRTGYGAESLLCREVEYMVRSMRESRESLDDLLKSLADRSCVAEIRQFVQICSICKRTGGDLERVIGKTAAILMEKIAVKREIQLVTSQKRLESKILIAIPVGMVLMLNILSPDYLAILYLDVRGRLVMTGALGGIIAASLISRKITEIAL